MGLLLCAFLAVLSLPLCHARLPHIFMVLVDDFGWAEVGYHRDNVTYSQVHTPTIDALVKQGVELNRHYVHMTCTPSRASLQSGRLPVHVLTQLAGPCDKNGAIPRNMTGVAAQLKRAGYSTHQVGKWDAGMATPHHTPQGRGYDSSLNYFSHANWMHSQHEWLGSYDHRADVPVDEGFVDLWDTDRPASHLNGTAYEEYIFRDRIQYILQTHDQTKPLFLQYDSKIAHYPMQAPQEYQEQFSFIQEDHRRMYHAMVAFLDDQLLNITSTMKQLDMWDNTLMVLSSDNGGYVKAFEGPCNTTDFSGLDSSDVGHGTVCMNGEAGASNYPLRGGKYSNFEGGIRVNAFASGGFLPPRVRGTKLEGMIHVADWYGTFATLAGLPDFVDNWAAESGLPPVDSLDVWPMLSGANLTSPRQGFLVTKDMLMSGEWKFVRGHTNMVEAASGGPHYPNASTAKDPIDSHSFVCPAAGCLFNVEQDPTEIHEVSAKHPVLAARLLKELNAAKKHIWSQPHPQDPKCKQAAAERWHGFYGPWLELDSVVGA